MSDKNQSNYWAPRIKKQFWAPRIVLTPNANFWAPKNSPRPYAEGIGGRGGKFIGRPEIQAMHSNNFWAPRIKSILGA
tara:strand:+ start:437 stop:670 length:234 start_codon:yes stop_codon:yes gene_type:complete